jgi:prephenate dehydrogenase
MATDPQDNMMRIAIAGSGGLARIFANYLNATVHPFIILSRQVRLPGDVQATEETTLTGSVGPT